MASESIAHEADLLRTLRARGIIVKYTLHGGSREAQLCLAMISGIVAGDTPVTSAIREIMIHAYVNLYHVTKFSP